MTTDLANTQSLWEGEARNAFDGRFEEWKGAANSLQQALEGMSSFLTTAAKTYEDAEDALRRANS